LPAGFLCISVRNIADDTDQQQASENINSRCSIQGILRRNLFPTV
jgi:hypothetical protein